MEVMIPAAAAAAAVAVVLQFDNVELFAPNVVVFAEGVVMFAEGVSVLMVVMMPKTYNFNYKITLHIYRYTIKLHI